MLDKIQLLGGWDNVLISSVSDSAHRAAEGQRLGAYAKSFGRDPYDVTVALLGASRGDIGMVGFGMTERNLERILAHPLGTVCSDGGAVAIEGPAREDICYATTNRQEAVKAIAPKSDALLVIGAPNSSNSNRLVEVATVHGCQKAFLVQRAAEIDWGALVGVKILGVTAGASAPEVLVDEVIEAAKARFAVTVEEVRIKDENVIFNVPKVLAA